MNTEQLAKLAEKAGAIVRAVLKERLASIIERLDAADAKIAELDGLVKTRLGAVELDLTSLKLNPAPQKGDRGEKGETGQFGESAFEIARANGFAGTEKEWIASLRGERGDTGANGKDGAPGKDGRDGVDGKDGAPGLFTQGEKGEPGVDGKDGAPGKDGRDGVDGRNGSDGIAGKDGEKGDRGEKGDPGDRGTDGKDGASAYTVAVSCGFNGTESEWAASLRGRDGKDGIHGDNGRDGKDGINGLTSFEVAVHHGFKGSEMEWLSSLRGADGKDGRDGADGRHGEDGRDALMIDPLPGIDETRNYPPRTYATHNGGLWIARRKTKGMEGWESLVRGIDHETEEVIDEGRAEKRTTYYSDGTKWERTIPRTQLKDRGIYREGTSYEVGDGATHQGSFWIAQKDTKSKPGEGNADWRLAVKRGRDGKDGARGEKGDRGDTGKPGKDLTQMTERGEKY